MINEEKVLDKIAEMLGDSCKMNEIYGSEDNVAYACGFNDRSLIELMRFVEECAEAEKYEKDEEGYLIPKNTGSVINRSQLNDVIDTITARMELYMNEITDCGGDQALFQGYEMAIEEDKFVLDLLVGSTETVQ